MVSSMIQISPALKLKLSVDEKKNINKTKWYLKLCQKMLLTNDKIIIYRILDIHDAAAEYRFINKKIVNKQSINIIIDQRMKRIASYVVNIAEEMMNISPSYTRLMSI
jgi:hypothetical protein